MTLATRCSACGTSFRVVQDQLKVSGGWVRCGRCGEVFNAIEGLYEVGSPMAERPVRRTAPPASSSVAPPSTAIDSVGGSTSHPEPPPEKPAEPEVASVDEAPPPAPPESVEPLGDELAPTVMPAVEQADEERLEAAAAAPVEIDFAEEPLEAVERTASMPSNAAQPIPPVHDDDLLVPSPADEWRSDDWPVREPAPSFVLAAEQALRPPRRGARIAWATVATLLLATLGVQASLAYRDVIAARWPETRSPLQLACSWIGCRVEPLRHIAALSVEASGLQQIGKDPVYGLSIALRNRSDIDLMMPALDLVLSDSQGRTIARKVMTMDELGRPSRVLAAGAETAGQATLATGGQRVSGYTIEIFYP